MFASGLEQNKSSVTSAAKNVAQSMADSFNNFSVDVNKQLSELKTNVQKQALSMVEDIKKIQKSMSDLDLNFSEDQASDDLGIAQSYVKQAETIKDLEKEISEARKKEDMTSSDMVKLQELEKQLSEEKSAYENLAWIKTDLDAAYREAVRLNDMTEIERQAEEYQKRKAQRLQEYEEKKAQLTKELNDAKVQATNLVATYENMKQAIMEQYKVASEYYQATIADNTLKTKDNAEKMVEYYNQVANAIKNTVKELQSLQSM
ncbi:MAG: hypothetical protein LBU27_06080 [Candidatus Peribacteria bacterium]|jgi:hypothetical protein|nr:hypothetical protein [Candidatus Peribacteria bacterium]